jgi:hypothetical protein
MKPRRALLQRQRCPRTALTDATKLPLAIDGGFDVPKIKGGQYEVGYGRPPAEHRFSATNQPKRPPRYLIPPGKRLIDRNEERVLVTRKDGTQSNERMADVTAEALIASALKGNVAAMEQVYLRYDLELDAASLRPPGVSEQRMGQLRKQMRDLLSRYFHATKMLETAGLIHASGAKLRLTGKAQELSNRRRFDR